MKGIIEGLLYVQGDLGLTIEQVSDILEIDKDTAKELITLGYLNPILEGFKEENIKEHISSLIERRM